MAVKMVLSNPLGQINSHVYKGKTVYKAISTHCYKGVDICDRISDLITAKNILLENSTEQNFKLHYYGWGNEKTEYVSCWGLFENGDWMDLGEKRSDLIKGNEGWSYNCPYS